jgi:hypothetical protein
LENKVNANMAYYKKITLGSIPLLKGMTHVTCILKPPQNRGIEVDLPNPTWIK